MEDFGKRIDVQNLLSLGDDLIGVLKNKKDGDSLMQSLEGAKTLSSSCNSDFNEVQNLLEDYQKKIDAYKQKVFKAKSETAGDAELEHLHNELEEELQRERLLRQDLSTIICDEIGGLERQRIFVEETKGAIKKKEKDALRAQDLLSMCVSVTSIIPNLDDQARISGYIVERNKKEVEKFEFESTSPPLEICNRLWKMSEQ